jgi:hypothetical protein
VTLSAAAGEGKKTDEGTMMQPPKPISNSKSDPVAVNDPCETQNPTPATTEKAPDI